MSEEKKERALKFIIELPESTIMTLLKWDPDEESLEEIGDIVFDIFVEIRKSILEKIRKALFEEE